MVAAVWLNRCDDRYRAVHREKHGPDELADTTGLYAGPRQ